MKYNKLIFLSLYFILPFGLYAQLQETLDKEILEEIIDITQLTSSKLLKISTPLEVAQAPLKGVYLDAAWSPAVVYTSSKEFLSTVARYNIHKSRMEIKVDNTIRKLHKHQINGIVLNGALFIPLASAEKEDGDNLQFFEVLSGGSLTLLSKYSLTLHTVGGSPMLKNIGTDQEYRSSERLYYCRDGEKPHQLKKGKKNILGLFESNPTMMEQIANDNDYGFRKESHLIFLFDQYNNL